MVLHEGRPLMNEISAFVKETPEKVIALLPYESVARRRWSSMSQDEWFLPDMEFKVRLVRHTHTLAFSGNVPLLQGLPGSSACKESACNAGDPG